MVCQLVPSGRIGKRRNSDGLDGCGQLVAMARHAISARGQRNRQQRNNSLHSNSLATATAFSAASLKLSVTIQNQQARGLLRSTVTEPTLSPLCPTAPTFDGGSSRRTSISADSRMLSSVSA